MMEPKISIVSLNYNRLLFTKKHLDNVLATTNVPFELIIVSNNDCGKSANVQSFIKDFKFEGKNDNLLQIKKVLNKKNYGVAGGRNSGLIHAVGQFKMVIDDDIILPSLWASNIISLIEGVSQIGVAGYCVEKERAAKKYKIKTYSKFVFQSKGRDNIGGACIVISPSTWEKLGFFNEEYGVFGFEDADYGVRVGAIGKINAYVYPERAVQMEDVINNNDYHVWKKQIYNKNNLRNILSRNIIKYQNGKGLYIGKGDLSRKWFDLLL